MAKIVSVKKEKAPRKPAKAAAAGAAPTEIQAAPEPMFEPGAEVEKASPAPAEPELPAERTVDSIKAAATEDARKDNSRLADEASDQLRPPSAPVEPTNEDTRFPDRRLGGFQRDRIATSLNIAKLQG